MRTTVFLVVLFCISFTSAALKKKPLCDMCEDVIEKLDRVLEKGEDMEKALEEYCDGECPDYLKMYCDKIDRSLKYIIEKLKEHDSPEEICTAIHLCAV